ncbi:MAG: phage holin family protein [Cyanobacteria bacterium P01_F01_bin.42]
MKRFLLTLAISAASLMITAYLIDGFEVNGIQEAVLSAFVLGFVNATIRPLLSFLTFPIRFLTLNAFSLVINAFMVWIVSQAIAGFTIAGPLPAFIGSLVLTIVSGILNLLVNPRKKR